MQEDPRSFTNLHDRHRSVLLLPREHVELSAMGSLREKKRGRKLEVVMRQFGDLSPAACSLEKPCLDQVGLINIFQGALILLNRRSQSLHADWSSAELFDDRDENFAVHLI